MKPLIQAVLFQGTWFACVLGGNVFALFVTLLYLFLHDRYFMNKRKEWRLMLLFLLLGVIVDGTFFYLDVFSVPSGTQWIENLPPIWLLCLWVCVATLFAHSLSFLQGRYWLSAGLGLVGPVFSYAAGAKMAGIVLASPYWLSLIYVGMAWSLILLLGVYLCGKWGLYSNEGGVHG